MSESTITEHVYIEIVTQSVGVAYTFSREKKEMSTVSLADDGVSDQVTVTRTVLIEAMAVSRDFNAITILAMKYALDYKISYLGVLE